jgi:hypothetical protein
MRDQSTIIKDAAVEIRTTPSAIALGRWFLLRPYSHDIAKNVTHIITIIEYAAGSLPPSSRM